MSVIKRGYVLGLFAIGFYVGQANAALVRNYIDIEWQYFPWSKYCCALPGTQPVIEASDVLVMDPGVEAESHKTTEWGAHLWSIDINNTGLLVTDIATVDPPYMIETSPWRITLSGFSSAISSVTTSPANLSYITNLTYTDHSIIIEGGGYDSPEPGIGWDLQFSFEINTLPHVSQVPLPPASVLLMSGIVLIGATVTRHKINKGQLKQ